MAAVVTVRREALACLAQLKAAAVAAATVVQAVVERPAAVVAAAMVRTAKAATAATVPQLAVPGVMRPEAAARAQRLPARAAVVFASSPIRS